MDVKPHQEARKWKEEKSCVMRVEPWRIAGAACRPATAQHTAVSYGHNVFIWLVLICFEVVNGWC
jgi:hypothetical protein